MITEDYCSPGLAQALQAKAKELFKYYHLADDEKIGLYKTVTHQRARRWLREIHNIFISINLTLTEDPDKYPPMYYVYIDDTKTGKSLIKYDETNLLVDENKQPRCFAEPEQAVEAAIKYCLENLI